MTPQTVDVPACTLCSRRARRAPDAIRDRTKKILVKRHPLSSIKWMRTRCASGGQLGCLKIFWSRQWGFKRENMWNTRLFILGGSLLKGATTGNHGFPMPSEGFRKNIFPGQIQGVRLPPAVGWFLCLQRFRHITNFWRRHYDHFPLVVMVGPGRWSVTEDWSGSSGWIGSDLLGCKICVMNVALCCP